LSVWWWKGRAEDERQRSPLASPSTVFVFDLDL
jgi:hypothetical protein